jgi:hypothetical protein
MVGKAFKYRMHCADCDAMVTTDGYIPEEDGAPTKCPVNAAHTDITQITIIGTIDDTIQKSKQIDTDGLDPNKANTVEEGFLIDIAAGVNPSRLNIAYAYPIDLLSGKYYVAHGEHSLLDTMSVFVIPPQDAAIGTVAQAAAVDDEEVYVDANALQNLKPGFFIKLQASEKEYRLLDIDYGTGKLTLDSGIDVAASIGNTVHVRIPFVINQLVLKNVLEKIGDAAAGSSNMPAGYTMRIDYNHENDPTVATKLGFALAYKY